MNKEKIIKDLIRSDRFIVEYNEKITARIKELEEGKKKWVEKSSELKKALKKAMKEAVEAGASDGKYKDENIEITYTKAFQRSQVDVELLKTKKPSIYKKFLKTVDISDSIKVKIK